MNRIDLSKALSADHVNRAPRIYATCPCLQPPGWGLPPGFQAAPTRVPQRGYTRVRWHTTDRDTRSSGAELHNYGRLLALRMAGPIIRTSSCAVLLGGLAGTEVTAHPAQWELYHSTRKIKKFRRQTSCKGRTGCLANAGGTLLDGQGLNGSVTVVSMVPRGTTLSDTAGGRQGTGTCVVIKRACRSRCS